jgi:RNA polymerase sigma-70 factor (ECF subfamily)
LAGRLRRGDEQALANIFSRNRERLWRMVNFRLHGGLRGRVDPDDVLQEAYLDAAKRIDHYASHPGMSPFVWLRLVVVQTLTDVHRRHLGARMRDVRQEVHIESCRYAQATSASMALQLIADRTSPSQAAARAEFFGTVEQAIDGMEPIDREVLALRHFEELSNTEVAEVLGIEQKAASIRYVRAVRRLKVILSELPEFPNEEQDVGPHDGT